MNWLQTNKVLFLSKFNQLLQITNFLGVQQIVAVLHTDVIETEYISQYFSHLSTLSVNLEPPYKNESNRLLFIYKKSTSKVIKEVLANMYPYRQVKRRVFFLEKTV